jgi:hypothetical protein
MAFAVEEYDRGRWRELSSWPTKPAAEKEFWRLIQIWMDHDPNPPFRVRDDEAAEKTPLRTETFVSTPRNVNPTGLCSGKVRWHLTA